MFSQCRIAIAEMRGNGENNSHPYFHTGSSSHSRGNPMAAGSTPGKSERSIWSLVAILLFGEMMLTKYLIQLSQARFDELIMVIW